MVINRNFYKACTGDKSICKTLFLVDGYVVNRINKVFIVLYVFVYAMFLPNQ
jgi:hypothetical protein